jgi:mRNA interferase MazF
MDFALPGKIRPALVVSAPFGHQDRSLTAVVPHTTSLRGSPFEIAIRVLFLKPGAFLVQGVTTFPTVRALHSIGVLDSEALKRVFDTLLRWLGSPRDK